MPPTDRWYDQPDAIAILSQPDDDHAAQLAARNDAKFARLHRRWRDAAGHAETAAGDAEDAPVALDLAGLDDWYARAERDDPFAAADEG